MVPVLADDLAVEGEDRAIGVTRESLIVGHDADRRTPAVKIAEELRHRLAVLRVEVAGGLVGKQDRPLAHQRARARAP